MSLLRNMAGAWYASVEAIIHEILYRSDSLQCKHCATMEKITSIMAELTGTR